MGNPEQKRSIRAVRSVAPPVVESVPIPSGIRTIADVLGDAPEEIEWVWEFLIPRGSVTVLSGKRKHGKSTLAYALVAAIARGEPFLNYRTLQVPTLVVCPEEHRRDINIRCWRFDIPREAQLYFLHRRQYTEFFLQVKAFCRQRSIGLVVVDTLSGWWGVDDENDNAKVQGALNDFLDLARSQNTGVLLIHHDAKAGNDARGASSLTGAVDQILKFRPGAEHTQRALFTEGRYDESPHELIASYNQDTSEYHFVGTNKDAIREATQEKIKLHLLKNGPSSAVVIATALGIKEGRVPAVLSDAEWCERTGEGKRGAPFLYGVKA